MANTIVWADIPVTDMGEMIGTIAFIIDSEGNRIGLHHPPAM